MTDLADIDLVDLDRFARGFPHDVFTLLRANAPVWWHPPHPKAPGGEGFWVLIFEWTTAFVDYSDRELGQSSERLRDAAIGVAGYGRELIARKRAVRGDDMLSIVVHAEVPDERGTARATS